MTLSPSIPAAQPSPRAEVIDLARTLAGGLLIALVLRVLVFQPFTIPSASMEPGVQQGDYIIVSKFSFGWSRYSLPLGLPLFKGRLLERAAVPGDVVVFQLPRKPSITYIKRVIGAPGDLVQVRAGVVYVNGRPLARHEVGLAADPDLDGAKVPVFRETGSHGRSYATFDRGPGHAGDDTGVYRVPAGYYFVMGDNRDNSLDSRWPMQTGVGLVPAENLVGKARFVLMSWKPGASIFKPWTWVMNLQSDRVLKPIR